MAYTTKKLRYSVASTTATTATLTTGVRQSRLDDFPSQIVLTFPNATPGEFVVGRELTVCIER